MSNEISSSDLVELIRGQARLEQKIDNFFTAQTWMRHELDTVKTDVSAVRADVAELKIQKRLSGSYLRGATAEKVSRHLIGRTIAGSTYLLIRQQK